MTLKETTLQALRAEPRLTKENLTKAEYKTIISEVMAKARKQYREQASS